MGLESIGRALLIFGGIVVVLGLVLIFADRIPFLGRLPGDIVFKRDGFSFYFPWVTFLVISVGLTMLINLVLWVLRR